MDKEPVDWAKVIAYLIIAVGVAVFYWLLIWSVKAISGR